MNFSCCKSKNSQKKLKKIVDFLKIISEENRLKILCILQKQEKCVCEIWQFLDIPQNLASHHLRVLKDAGLIDSRKEGLKMIYRINKKEMSKFNSLLDNFLQTYGE